MRYTEARLTAAAMEMVASIDEDTVDFMPNYDGTRAAARRAARRACPNLLVNGAAGIAVGMATNMAPHNLGEVIAAARHLITAPGRGAGRADAVRARARPAHRRQDRRASTGSGRRTRPGRGIFRTRATAPVEQITRAAPASWSPSCPTASARRRS